MRDDFPLEQEFLSKIGEHARGAFERIATSHMAYRLEKKTFFLQNQNMKRSQTITMINSCTSHSRSRFLVLCLVFSLNIYVVFMCHVPCGEMGV